MSELLTTVPFPALIIIAIVVAASTIYMWYSYLRDHTIEQIRGDAYQLILKAEHMYQESSAGKQKMKWVVNQARKLLPGWLQVIVTDEVLQKIIQVWFDEIKDLLDDGKANGSQKQGTETSSF